MTPKRLTQASYLCEVCLAGIEPGLLLQFPCCCADKRFILINESAWQGP